MGNRRVLVCWVDVITLLSTELVLSGAAVEVEISQASLISMLGCPALEHTSRKFLAIEHRFEGRSDRQRLV